MDFNHNGFNCKQAPIQAGGNSVIVPKLVNLIQNAQ